ncbi:MAG: hypothetical protein K0U29_04735 [Gammaproteobacteria bacterium]|nr:hypothetical protein [Gammaproteobacteria bacterium]MCH9744222.1 hypothetical protein [Gammaproteobacteria bacterium]
MKTLTKTLAGITLMVCISSSAIAGFPPIHRGYTGFNVNNTTTTEVNAQAPAGDGPDNIPPSTQAYYGTIMDETLTVVVGDTSKPNGTCTLYSEGETPNSSTLTLKKQSNGSQGFTCSINNKTFELTKP